MANCIEKEILTAKNVNTKSIIKYEKKNMQIFLILFSHSNLLRQFHLCSLNDFYQILHLTPIWANFCDRSTAFDNSITIFY